ncbi:MAG: amidohydrolase family protein [Victivallaceae bacterium]|nr:amidohydrolase family protein [Victivallaceae bacterium]MDD3116551.1 amidohydrolase family protein [Victivallaceae bacterium]MDD3703810.1 amidohydrolase family protein [Victivallaceae bacterium]MDD4318539.1 amidohydrolase family protein [Victivallaceae bacterium]
MKIIDTHIHFSGNEHFQQIAEAAGQINSPEFLAKEFSRHNIVKAIAMGTRSSQPGEPGLPQLPDLAGIPGTEGSHHPECIAYCCGVDSFALDCGSVKKSLNDFERHLSSSQCAGIKIYPGYQKFFVNDRIHYPFYELVQHYRKAVVIHTGDTAGGRGLLKYAHPLTVDEVAVEFPEINFVMAHYGNPWIVDATAVAAKNTNVYIELSGLAQGSFEADWFVEHYHGYIEHLKTWITYLSDHEKFLFGSDWPLVGYDSYIELIKRIVPESCWNQVFYANAERIFFA